MKIIRIGSRNSPLALWQAREVARHLQNRNYKTEITPIVSSGDKNLTQPLYEMGITGIFTKDLDIALINNQIDIAVHSLKDIPTRLPNLLTIFSVLKRDYPADILVRKSTSQQKPFAELKIATSSQRRKAFWSKDFPRTLFSDIRGNVHTRLEKVEKQDFDATIFSQAAIERMKLHVPYEILPQMISAPGQGVVAVMGRKTDQDLLEILQNINDVDTEICINIERTFLQIMEGGCTAPIGAYAELHEGQINFKARICSLDGKNCVELEKVFPLSEAETQPIALAEKMLKEGGKEIMQTIRERQ